MTGPHRPLRTVARHAPTQAHQDALAALAVIDALPTDGGAPAHQRAAVKRRKDQAFTVLAEALNAIYGIPQWEGE